MTNSVQIDGETYEIGDVVNVDFTNARGHTTQLENATIVDIKQGFSGNNLVLETEAGNDGGKLPVGDTESRGGSRGKHLSGDDIEKVA